MGSIRDMDREIRYQMEDLPVYREYLRELRAEEEEKCAFIGAGDSYAAALAAEYHSNLAKALDPYEAVMNPLIMKNRLLYVVSVSGRTTANIEAARRGRRFAKRVTAITANPRSRLAEECDDIIELRFRRTGALTPGTSSFTASLLACLSRLTPLPPLSDLRRVYKEALAWSDEMLINPEATSFFVGSGFQYALAYYGAAKVYEVFGGRAQYQRTEQFSHMEVFTLAPEDTVILIPYPEGRDERAEALKGLLKNGGFTPHTLRAGGENTVASMVNTALYLQVLAWRSAEKKGVEECAFLTKKHLLKISDAMIY